MQRQAKPISQTHKTVNAKDQKQVTGYVNSTSNEMFRLPVKSACITFKALVKSHRHHIFLLRKTDEHGYIAAAPSHSYECINTQNDYAAILIDSRRDDRTHPNVTVARKFLPRTNGACPEVGSRFVT